MPTAQVNGAGIYWPLSSSRLGRARSTISGNSQSVEPFQEHSSYEVTSNHGRITLGLPRGDRKV